ncbi:helix-turn-helix domain-containing protein [Salibacter halophilus]|nr:helix-turn-helix domain-containing protein [Salibacter halophilus]
MKKEKGTYLVNHSSLEYYEFPAPPFLRDYVSLFWFDSYRAGSMSPMIYNLIADGEPGIIYQGIPGSISINGFSDLPALMIYGQKTRWATTVANPPYSNIGIVLKPYALKTLFGINAADLTNSALPLSELVACKELCLQLASGSLSTQLNALVQFLCNLKTKPTLGLNRTKEALLLYYQGHQLHDIQRNLKVSERTLERNFKEELGVSPVLYKRIHRFNYALNLLHQKNLVSLTSIGYQAGYADQSHFIRDFKAFAGITPKEYLIKSKGNRGYPKQ